MSPWSRFPFVRLTFALLGGILLARYYPGWGWVVVGLLAALLPAYAWASGWRCWRPWLGLLGLGGIFLLGYVRLWMEEVHTMPDHLMQWAAGVEAYEAVALEDVRDRAGHGSVVVAVRRARVMGVWRWVVGRVKVSFPKAEVPLVRYGDVLLVLGRPCAVPRRRNPNEFDYAAFLALAQIRHQHWVRGGGVAVVGYCPPSRVQAWSFQVLRRCRAWLGRCMRQPTARAVVRALVLGDRDGLTPVVREAYAASGTLHVLAVSGLHVGLLYWLVGLLLGWLRSIRLVRVAAPAVSLGVLGFYAFVTGLSPSVLRATLMFGLVTVAPLLGRRTNVYNTLAASAFVLLCWQPLWLFAVGFQLSYLAVLGIVYLQPRFYGCWRFGSRVLDRLWLLSSVSLAAQVATAPLSLYYFHQFPTYFLVANWVVVPAAALILCLGLLVLATAFWPGLSGAVAWLLEWLVGGVNGFVTAVRALPYGLVEDVVLSGSTVVLLYAALVLWLAFWHTRRFRYLVATSLVLLLMAAFAVRQVWVQQGQRKLIFYSIDGHRVVAFVRGRCGVLYTTDAGCHAYHVRPSLMAMGVCTTREVVPGPPFPLRDWRGLRVAVWQGKRIIFVDKNSMPLPRWTQKVSTDFLVVEGNAVHDLALLCHCFDFGVLVIGASNDQALAQQLQEAAAQRGRCSHSLRRQGALVVALDDARN